VSAYEVQVSKIHSLKEQRQKGQLKVRICTPGSSLMRSCSFIVPCVQTPHMNFPHSAHLMLELSPKAVAISMAPQNGMSHIRSRACSEVGSFFISCNNLHQSIVVPCLVCMLAPDQHSVLLQNSTIFNKIHKCTCDGLL